MRKLLISLLIIFSFLANAQLTIIIDSVPDYTPVDADIYLAGDLNSWNPADADYKFTKISENKWQIVLPEMDSGMVILFKFTRGSWETVEKGASGEEIGNRHYTFGNGGIINPIILNWADNGGGGGGSTASENVSIMDDSFYMPQFDRNRRIWIYLPPNYESSQMHFPVMYMHDGQNLFDTQTSYAGEWEVDETLDELYAAGLRVPIVIGVDNGGGNRIDEYTPWVNPEYGGGDGRLHIDFIVETLKPYIDENYRTITDRNNTAIMGSSLGGLISHYGSIKFQNKFGKAGIFSPSYWWSDSVWSFTNSNSKQFDMMIYQMCGDLESVSTVPNMNLMNTYLTDAGFLPNELFLKVVAGGQHNEQLWRNEFEEAYLWLFSDYISSINEYRLINKLEIVPNPSSNKISFPDYVISNNDRIEIIDMNGVTVLNSKMMSGDSVNINHLAKGVYLVRVTNDKAVFEGKFIKD